MRPGRFVALALLEGPRIAGLPSDAQGFIPVTELGEVRGLDGVYAAGDATAYPIKHGGVAAQQADVVAAAIAARAGLTGDPQPLQPVIRGALLTGLGTRYLEATPIGDGLRFDRQRRRPIGSAHEDRRSPPRALSRPWRPPRGPRVTPRDSALTDPGQTGTAPDEAQLDALLAHWDATNYLTVVQIYLLANPLLREPLRAEHIKPRLLGHGGTCGRARWTRGCCCTCSRRASSPTSSPPGSSIARACWA